MATTKQVTYRTTDDTLIATLPDGRKVELSTELTFDELMKVGAIAVALESDGLDEMRLFGMLSDGTLIPPSVREKIGSLPARHAFQIFMKWLMKAVDVLGELGNLGEAPASS